MDLAKIAKICYLNVNLKNLNNDTTSVKWFIIIVMK